MSELKQAISNVPDVPRPGVLFRDISPLLRDHFDTTMQALDALLTDEEWSRIDALAGIESRGFILGAAVAGARLSRAAAARDSCWCASKASCRRPWSTCPTISSTGPASWRCSVAGAAC